MKRLERSMKSCLSRIDKLRKQHTAHFNAEQWPQMQSVGRKIIGEYRRLDSIKERMTNEAA